MKAIVVLLAAAVMAGCTITTKEPRDELVARNMALEERIETEAMVREFVRDELFQMLRIYDWADGRRAHRPGGSQ